MLGGREIGRFPHVRIRGRSPEGESHHEDSCGDGDAEDAYLHRRSVSARPAKKLAVQRASRLDTKNTSNVHPKPVRCTKSLSRGIFRARSSIESGNGLALLIYRRNRTRGTLCPFKSLPVNALIRRTVLHSLLAPTLPLFRARRTKSVHGCNHTSYPCEHP